MGGIGWTFVGWRRGVVMDEVLDARVSVLVAQVRKAKASHKMDTTNRLLRSRHFQGPSTTVYLGDVAQAVLAHLAHPETPFFSAPPGYNEQRWVLETTSSELEVRIESYPYWGAGLLTSGYLNVITLTGPLQSRARLVLDVASSLGQSPWELAHVRRAQRYLDRHHPGLSLKENEQLWNDLRAVARDHLSETIQRILLRKQEIEARLEDAEHHKPWLDAIAEDTDMAWKAQAEDNAPGVERALARIEAALIHLDPALDSPTIEAPSERFSSGTSLAEWPQGPTGQSTKELSVLLDEEDIPFVDLTAQDEVLEEE